MLTLNKVLLVAKVWDAPHLFAGADTAKSPSADQQGQKVVDGSDPLAFGRNLEAIAKGEVVVR